MCLGNFNKAVDLYFSEYGQTISRKNLIKLYNYLNAAEKFTAADYIKGLIEKFDTLSGLYGNFKRLCEVLSVNSVGCGKKF